MVARSSHEKIEIISHRDILLLYYIIKNLKKGSRDFAMLKKLLKQG